WSERNTKVDADPGTLAAGQFVTIHAGSQPMSSWPIARLTDCCATPSVPPLSRFASVVVELAGGASCRAAPGPRAGGGVRGVLEVRGDGLGSALESGRATAGKAVGLTGRRRRRAHVAGGRRGRTVRRPRVVGGRGERDAVVARRAASRGPRPVRGRQGR